MHIRMTHEWGSFCSPKHNRLRNHPSVLDFSNSGQPSQIIPRLPFQLQERDPEV
jgi:hypothetical protein